MSPVNIKNIKLNHTRIPVNLFQILMRRHVLDKKGLDRVKRPASLKNIISQRPLVQVVCLIMRLIKNRNLKSPVLRRKRVKSINLTKLRNPNLPS